MERFVYLDYETSDSRCNYGSVVSAALIVTNEKLKVKSKHNLKCRLKPNVIPSIGASLVHRIPVVQLKNSNMSHYQMVLEHYKIIKDKNYPVSPIGKAAQELILTEGLENWIKEKI